MRYLLLTLALLAGTAAAQVTTNDTPTLTNNVQYIWGSAQAATLKTLWRDDYSRALASYQAATNADPAYATNAAPTLPVFATWASSWFRGRAAAQVSQADMLRTIRLQQELQTSYAAAKALFEQSWGLLTPAQQATQSNTWWTAASAQSQ